MSILPRKLTFQLTPLLDLLLIVIFAQYMEVQQTSAESEAQIADRIQEAQAALADVQQQQETGQQRVADMETENLELRQEMQKQQIEDRAALELAIQQRNLVGELTAELFRLPDELVEALTEPHTATEAPRPPEDTERLRQRFRELARQRGPEVVKHLLTYEELRKRCDIWEIFIQENGTIGFTAGQRTQEFRAADSRLFEGEVFDRYKSLPQPKGLVIILVSYGDAQAGVRKAVLDGLPLVTERMRADSNGRTRFEYANLGFQPTGPSSMP